MVLVLTAIVSVMTILESSTITALQSIFEALNAIAGELPPGPREKVEAAAIRVARAKSAIKADAM